MCKYFCIFFCYVSNVYRPKSPANVTGLSSRIPPKTHSACAPKCQQGIKGYKSNGFFKITHLE